MTSAALIAVLAATALARPLPVPARAIVIAFGGSLGPDQTPLDMERALMPLTVGPALIADEVLFGDGDPHHPLVQVEPVAGRAPTLRELLGSIVGDPADLAADYRPPLLRRLTGANRHDLLLARVVTRAKSAAPGQPLLVVGVGHGGPPRSEADKPLLQLWGSDTLSVDELAAALDEQAPATSVALVLGHCFSGDFARISHRAADPAQPLAPRCALLATTASRTAAGCDPRTDSPQNFVELAARALASGDRAADLDRDGQLTLADLHGYLRMRDHTVDIPTLSSETLLHEAISLESDYPEQKQRVSAVGAKAPAVERTVIAALVQQLKLKPDTTLAGLDRRLADVLAQIVDLTDSQQNATNRQQAARDEVVSAIAERWPQLLNPFRRDFESVLKRAEPELANELTTSALARRLQKTDDEVATLNDQLATLELQEALLTRLSSALENSIRWQRLRASDPAAMQALQTVLACEQAPLVSVRGNR